MFLLQLTVAPSCGVLQSIGRHNLRGSCSCGVFEAIDFLFLLEIWNMMTMNLAPLLTWLTVLNLLPTKYPATLQLCIVFKLTCQSGQLSFHAQDDTEGEVLNAEALQELLGGGSGGRRATSKYKAKAAAIARMAGATSKKMATNTSGKGKRRWVRVACHPFDSAAIRMISSESCGRCLIQCDVFSTRTTRRRFSTENCSGSLCQARGVKILIGRRFFVDLIPILLSRRSPQRLDFNNIPELPDIVKGTRKQTCLAKAAGKASVKQQRLSQEQQYLVGAIFGLTKVLVSFLIIWSNLLFLPLL